VAYFGQFETTVTNHSYMHEETESKLNLGSSFYGSVQNLLSSCLRSKNVKMLPVPYGCEVKSVSIWKKHRLRMI